SPAPQPANDMAGRLDAGPKGVEGGPRLSWSRTWVAGRSPAWFQVRAAKHRHHAGRGDIAANGPCDAPRPARAPTIDGHEKATRRWPLPGSPAASAQAPALNSHGWAAR